MIPLIFFLFSLSLPTMVHALETETLKIEKKEKLPFYLIKVKVAGSLAEVEMLFDTGASETVLAEWWVDELKIPKSSKFGNGSDATGTSFKMSFADVSSFQIGETKKSNQRLPIVSRPSLFKDLKIAGMFRSRLQTDSHPSNWHSLKGR